ncbi:hypothetical protein ACFL02_09735 [Planctomycetota bacterium]
MQTLTDKVYEHIPTGIFTFFDVACLVNGSNDKQYNLIKRAIAAGEIIQIRRGLYCLAPKYSREKISPFGMAQQIYGPSYISLESALSWHGWIPEAVYCVTNASFKRSTKFETSLGGISYVRVPQKVFYAEVERHSDKTGNIYFMASAMKALTDYVYAYKKDWKSADPVIKSLRVDEESLNLFTGDDLEALIENYSNNRVKRFLKGLKRDLKL